MKLMQLNGLDQTLSDTEFELFGFLESQGFVAFCVLTLEVLPYA
jgi:hypothetical protein